MQLMNTKILEREFARRSQNFAMKDVPIAAKIGGSIGILSHCILNNFFT